MARKRFIVFYPDSSKEQIGTTERDSLLVSGSIRKISEGRYEFTGQRRTFHSFPDYGKHYVAQQTQPSLDSGPNYLSCHLKFQAPDGSIREEREETPKGLVLRLIQRGLQVSA